VTRRLLAADLEQISCHPRKPLILIDKLTAARPAAKPVTHRNEAQRDVRAQHECKGRHDAVPEQRMTRRGSSLLIACAAGAAVEPPLGALGVRLDFQQAEPFPFGVRLDFLVTPVPIRCVKAPGGASMARQPRFFVPGEVLHVIQRGNNHVPIFAAAEDYRFFLECFRQSAQLHGLVIHAYVLMTNHVHFLATATRKDSLPKVMQSVGRRYVQYFNSACQRTGTLWEGRYRAAIVDSECYLLTCMRYIELNPVRAGMAAHPAEYPWTSYRVNGEGSLDDLITPHELYQRLGRSATTRESAYRKLFHTRLSGTDVEAIREATNKNWALGGEYFKQRVETLSGRRPDRLEKGRRAGPG
jgi:putative transposase